MRGWRRGPTLPQIATLLARALDAGKQSTHVEESMDNNALSLLLYLAFGVQESRRGAGYIMLALVLGQGQPSQLSMRVAVPRYCDRLAVTQPADATVPPPPPPEHFTCLVWSTACTRTGTCPSSSHPICRLQCYPSHSPATITSCLLAYHAPGPDDPGDNPDDILIRTRALKKLIVG